MAKSLINIGGEVREASDVKLPDGGRAFRDAWHFNGDVIEIDMPKAKEIRMKQLLDEAERDARDAKSEVWKSALTGNLKKAADARQRWIRRKAGPKVDAVVNAADAYALAALTIDDVT